MPTISQVVSEQSLEVFETSTIFPSQSTIPTQKSDEASFKSSILTTESRESACSLRNESEYSSLPKESVSTSSVRKSVSSTLSKESASTSLPKESASFIPQESATSSLPKESVSFVPQESATSSLLKESVSFIPQGSATSSLPKASVSLYSIKKSISSNSSKESASTFLPKVSASSLPQESTSSSLPEDSASALPQESTPSFLPKESVQSTSVKKSISSTSSKESISSSLTKKSASTSLEKESLAKESSSKTVLKSVKSGQTETIRTIEEILNNIDLPQTPVETTVLQTLVLQPIPIKLPIVANELSSTALVKNVQSERKAKIRTIEELLDSSSDLDLPTTTPPPPPVSEPIPPVSVAPPQPVKSVSPAPPLITQPPAIPKKPPPKPNKMSANKDIFNNGACKEISAPKVAADSNTLTSTISTATDSTNSIDSRSTSVSPTPTTATTIAVPGGISVNHYERLIEELKCPGCASPMKAPIKLCSTGHSICQHCTTVLMLCPLCKQPFIDLRSLTLEALCSKAHFRCCNAAAGCTVRLQIDLLNWHEKQCIWKSMKCFMGRVWGDCNWTGREAGWKDHLETAHSDRVFKSNEANLIWNMNGKVQPLAGYYVFEVYDEMFNFYQVYDRDRILFTMTVTSTVRDRKHNFAYEVEMFHKDNEALVITQRFPVHSEYDKDILLDGTCVCVALTDVQRLIDQDKSLHFRVRINEVKSPKKNKAPKKPCRKHPIDFQKTEIEGANLKSVPAGVILTRKLDDVPLEPVKDNDEEKDLTKEEETSSSDDPEFEAFIEKNWGTPQMNFNRKYLKSAASKDSSSSSGSSILSSMTDSTANGMQRSSCESGGTKSRMRNVTSSLRKSFRSLKTDIIELKKPFTAKKSPEKKESLIKK